jgi:hypothetical protein
MRPKGLRRLAAGFFARPFALLRASAQNDIPKVGSNLG